MDVVINNFRGIKEAEFSLRHITIIGGDNGAGKTSIAQAIGAALTGESPIKDLKKGDYGRLINSYSSTACIEVIALGGKAIMSYPEGKGYTNGNPPCSSLYATGLLSPVEMSKKESMDCWISLLKSEPTLDDLREELKGNPRIEEIVALVRMRDFDGALKEISEEGSKCKGRWEKITGERYGTKKGDTWKPANFLMGVEKEQLEVNLKKAQEEYNEGLKRTAVDDHEHKRLMELVEKLPVLKEKEKEITGCIELIQKSFDEHKLKLDEALASENILFCPHCNKEIIYQNGKIIPAEKKGEYDLPKLKNQQAEFIAEIGKLNAEIDKIRFWINQSVEAQKKLNEAVKGEAPKGLETTLALCKAELQAYKDFYEAQKEHSEVLWRAEVHKVLAPDGLRKKKTDDKIKAFNEILSEICSITRWGMVMVDADFNVTYGGRIYQVLSESEQYRVRATIQMAVGFQDKSDVLIFDRVDLLTRDGRNGLRRACKSLPCHSIILLSANNREEFPKIDKEDEVSYWVENGEVS